MFVVFSFFCHVWVLWFGVVNLEYVLLMSTLSWCLYVTSNVQISSIKNGFVVDCLHNYVFIKILEPCLDKLGSNHTTIPARVWLPFASRWNCVSGYSIRKCIHTSEISPFSSFYFINYSYLPPRSAINCSWLLINPSSLAKYVNWFWKTLSTWKNLLHQGLRKELLFYVPPG